MLGGRIRVALATETVAEDYAGPTWSVPYGYADGQGSSSIVRKSYNLSADVQYGASYFDLKGGNVAQNRKAAVNEDEPLQYRIGLNLQF